MENLVPLGTGNSRLMKSNIPPNTTLAQLIQMWNNGTFPYDIGPLNSAGISQQGTPLNKATLLKDATAALFGLGTDAVPDDALSAINTLIQAAQSTADGKASIVTGSYVGTGTYGPSNPNTLVFDFVPKLVIIADTANSSQMNIWYTGLSQGIYPYNSYLYNQYTLSGTALSWYNSQATSASDQLNFSGREYAYFAIG